MVPVVMLVRAPQDLRRHPEEPGSLPDCQTWFAQSRRGPIRSIRRASDCIVELSDEAECLSGFQQTGLHQAGRDRQSRDQELKSRISRGGVLGVSLIISLIWALGALLIFYIVRIAFLRL